MSFAPWEAATACTAGPTPGARALMSGALTAYASHGATSMGIYNCRAVRGTTGTVSCHGEGRACDVGFPMIDGGANPAGQHLVDTLRPDAEALGIQAIIYDRVIYSARSPEGRPYTGVSPHYDHVHIELTRRAGRELTLATVQTVLGDGSTAIELPGTDETGTDGSDTGSGSGSSWGDDSDTGSGSGTGNGTGTGSGSGTGSGTGTSGGGVPTLPPTPRPVLRVGAKGAAVRFVQHVVGVTPDGDFGPRTAAAVRAFQADEGLVPDGVVGPATWSRLALASTPA